MVSVPPVLALITVVDGVLIERGSGLYTVTVLTVCLLNVDLLIHHSIIFHAMLTSRARETIGPWLHSLDLSVYTVNIRTNVRT